MGVKLGILVAIPLILLIFITIFNSHTSQQVEDVYTYAYKQFSIPASNFNTYRAHVQGTQKDVLKIILLDDPAKIKPIADDLAARRAEAVSIVQEYQKTNMDDKEKALMAKISQFSTQFRALQDKALELGERSKADEEAIALFFDQLDPVTDQYNSTIVELATYLNELTVAAQKNAGEYADKMANLAIAIAAAAIIITLILGVIISRGISKPLNTIVGLAKRAEEGDLTIAREEFHYEGKDELGSLVEALSNMVSAQEATMQEVVAVAGELSSSANNLSSISEETNASMEEVKASVDQVSSLSESNGAALEECNAGVEEMSAGADTVAQSATDSAAFIAQTTSASNKAIKTVNDVIAGMRNVDKNSKESEVKIRQLVSSVENVSSFVSVITGIADQTNLLALNAAIEAARAGEVGRGFAVVAEEVRKLAEESARAAQNVNGIIVELQNGAQGSIKATTEAGSLLVETLSHAEQAQKELDGALQEINKANDSIQNIAAVAEEQAASSKEVATAIDSATKSTMETVETISNIRRAVDETSQAAQGVAEQSEAMNGHAQSLDEVLSRFTLKDASSLQKGAKKQKALKGR
jgi:methyl-accepting chemotaxis protein